MEIADGSMSGSLDGVPFTGDFGSARAYAVGAASGTNPGGTGRATWRGVAEAASTGTFERRQGSATVMIADRLEGNFHGPDHGEAWGVFDTSAHVGAFGTKRVP